MASEQFRKFLLDFEYKISQDMGRLRIPGTVIALLENGKILYQGNFGTKDRATNSPVDQESLFGIGSCTKSFTSLAILQLAENGLLNIDDPVNKYIPLLLGSKENPITIRHLMSHASGIPALDSSLTINYLLGEDKEIPIIPLSTKEDFFRFVNNASSELIFDPNEKFFYSNGGYVMLGYIIEEVSGLGYTEYIRKNIFKPLGMADSTFLNDKNLESNQKLAKGYVIKKSDILQIQTTVDHINNPAYGIVSSIPNLISYLQALMDRDTKLLKKTESFNELFKSQNSAETFDFNIPSSKSNGYGFGWFVYSEFYGKKLLTHSGDTGNYSAQLIMLPDEKVALILLANSYPSPSFNHLIALLEAYLGYNPKEINIFYKKQENKPKFLGKYKNYMETLTIEVNDKKGTLFLEINSGGSPMSLPIIPVNDELNCLEYFYFNSDGMKEKIFFIEKNNKLYIKFDRYLFSKELTFKL